MENSFDKVAKTANLSESEQKWHSDFGSTIFSRHWWRVATRVRVDSACAQLWTDHYSCFIFLNNTFLVLRSYFIFIITQLWGYSWIFELSLVSGLYFLAQCTYIIRLISSFTHQATSTNDTEKHPLEGRVVTATGVAEKTPVAQPTTSAVRRPKKGTIR